MRLLSVLIRDLEDDRKSLITYITTIVGIITAMALLGAIAYRFFHQGSDEVYSSSYYAFLFLGGAIFTSLMFSDDLYSRIKNHQFLMLPASPLEKFLSRALIIAVIYPLALTVLFSLASLILEPLMYLFFSEPITLFNPFTRAHIISYLHYVTVTSVFFLGSVYFRKIHFFKTILAVLGVLFSLGIITMFLMRLIFTSYFVGWELTQEFQSYFTIHYSYPFKTWETVGNIVYFVLFPLYFYTVAYFRMKEVQATDALQ